MSKHWAQKVKEKLAKSEKRLADVWKQPLKKSKDDGYGTLMDRWHADPSNYSHVNDAAEKLIEDPRVSGLILNLHNHRSINRSKSSPKSFYNQVLTAAVKNHPNHPNAKKLVDAISRSDSNYYNHEPLDAALAQSPHPKPGWLYEEDKHHLIPVEHLKEMALDKEGSESLREEAMNLWRKKDPQNAESAMHRAALAGDKIAAEVIMPNLSSVDDKLDIIKATGDAHTLGRLAGSGEITPHQFANAFTSTMTPDSANNEAQTLFQVPPEYVAETGKQVARNPTLTKIAMDNPHLLHNLGHHLPDQHLYSEASAGNTNALKFLKDNKPELMQNVVARVNLDAQEFGHPNPETHKRARDAIKKMKDDPSLFKPSQETLAHLRNHPKGEKFYHSLLLKTLKYAKKDTPIKNRTVAVSMNTGKLRQARDMAMKNDGSVHVQDLREAGLDPAGLKIEHLKDGKGRIPAQAIQGVIDSAPKANFGVSTGVYKGGFQTHDSAQPSKVFRLDMSPEKQQELKDAGVYKQFQEIAKRSKRSGHPVKDNTIGWVRYTHNADGFHMDEVQSDFGQSLARQVSEIKRKQAAGELGAGSAEGLDENQILKINDILFGKAHPSQLVHEGFLQSLRDSGHAGNKVHIWQTEPKSVISGMSREPMLSSVGKEEAMDQKEFKDRYGDSSAQKSINENLSAEQIHDHINQGHALTGDMLNHPNFNDTHMESAISKFSDPESNVHTTRSFDTDFHSKLNSDQVGKLAQAAIKNRMSAETGGQIGRAVETAAHALKSPHLSQEHHDRLFQLLKDNDPGALAYSHRMKPEQASEILSNPRIHTFKNQFLRNSPLIEKDPSFINQYANDYHSEILNNPHLSDNTLQKLSQNPNVFKKQIVAHPNASDDTKSQLISGLGKWALPDVLPHVTPKTEPAFLSALQNGLNEMGTKDDSWDDKEQLMRQLGRKLSDSPNLSHGALSSIEALGRKHLLNGSPTRKDLAVSIATHPGFPDELRMDKIKSLGNPLRAIEELPRHFVMSPEDISYVQNYQDGGTGGLSVRLAKQPNFNEAHTKKAIELGHLPYLASQAKPDAEGKMSLNGVYIGMKKPPLPVHMREGYGDIPKKMGYKPDQYGDISTQANTEHEGAPTWSQTLRKSLARRKAKK
jgi:hypothetical protein